MWGGLGRGRRRWKPGPPSYPHNWLRPISEPKRWTAPCGDNGPRSSLGIEPGLDDALGPYREFAVRFTEGIRKLAGSTAGDHWKKTR
ncbi:hypothetical protein GW17_00050142 [Ensete ventricosum]|nr:hypothetical protein GW17_00050142 [Ensete ventricosum]